MVKIFGNSNKKFLTIQISWQSFWISGVVFDYSFVFNYSEWDKKYDQQIYWRGLSLAYGKVDYEGQIMPHYHELVIDYVPAFTVFQDKLYAAQNAY